ncbi:MAG: sulfate ABC transporter substrate-binding protein [Wolinella succinogenes]|uniref:sulfate ABC transporter substrate-binding protein n=1 Tax=Wolinella succinogenes TaxID=844 RepID=UPI0016BA7BF4|nr:sulfate ABC transporter substrate-binding protein [Wolinella succinogenes]NLU34279.1 sulfate ABC transporter substrate-binding protein [Wolinella succinogenes]
MKAPTFKRLFYKTLFALAILEPSLYAAEIHLLNVSYDPTREFYREYNAAFSKHYKEQTGDEVKIRVSHGGSGSQARSVIDGLDADIVTLALAYDIDAISQKTNLIPPNWQDRLAHNSSPYTSTIVFLVRQGNPKKIKDWDDLTRSDVKVITPNPKTSGGARWNYLAAWAYAQKHSGGDEEKSREFLGKLFANVPVLDSGARGATNTFVQRGLGDVLLAWENEAFLAINELGKGKFEIIVPTLSILAEPPVSLVDKVSERKKTTQVAQSYLEYLYSKEAQRIAGKHYYRPSDPEVAKEFQGLFPALELVTIDGVFNGWQEAQKKHFSDGGEFDKIFAKLRR